MKQGRKLVLIATVAICLMLAGAAFGADANWSVDADGNWADNANWTAAYPNAAGETATFGDIITANRAVTVGGGATITVGHMVFDASNMYTIQGDGTGLLVFDGGGADATVTINSGRQRADFVTANLNYRLDSNLVVTYDGGGELYFGHASTNTIDLNGNTLTIGRQGNYRFGGITDSDGNGIVIFQGNGTKTGDGFDGSNWTGETFINDGVVKLWFSRLGATSHAYVADGATIITQGDWTMPHDITIQGTGHNGQGVLHRVEWVQSNWTGTVALAADSRINTDGVSMLVLTNTVDGNGGIEKVGTGRLVLQGDNTYAGDTTIANGTVIADNSAGSATGTGTVIVTSAGVFAGDGNVAGIDLTGELRPGDTWTGGGSPSVNARPGSLGGVDANFNAGGLYMFDINDANGTAGSTTGWDLLNLSGTLDLSDANSSNKFTIAIQSLSASDTPGDASNFDSAGSYAWQIIAPASVVGFDETALLLDPNITNAGTDSNLFGIRTNEGAEDVGLYLVYNVPTFELGDVNGDGNVDNLDITPFIYALVNEESAFDTEYPAGEYWAADCKTDGNVDNLDITPFISILVGGGQAVPEPASAALLVFALSAVVRRRRRR